MSTVHENTALDELLDPVARCFTPEVARQIASLQADPALESRLDELARKANEGELSEREHEQYEAYVEAIDVIAVLQSKARRILARDAAS